jgi:hypothetical protein
MGSPSQVADVGLFAGYELGDAWDEMFNGSGEPRQHYGELHGRLLAIPAENLRRMRRSAFSYSFKNSQKRALSLSSPLLHLVSFY